MVILLFLRYKYAKNETVKYQKILQKIHTNFVHDLYTTEAGINETKASGQTLSDRLFKTVYRISDEQIQFLRKAIDNGETVKFNADIYAFNQGNRMKLSYNQICKDQRLINLFRPVVKKVYEMAKTNLKIKQPLYVSKIQCWRWEKGQELRNHADGHTYNTITKSWRKMRGCNPDVSSVWYLSEHGKDFQGGLLEFVDSTEKILPKTGDLYVFESGPKNVHKMTRMITGNKYICTVLLTKDPSSDNDKSRLFLK